MSDLKTRSLILRQSPLVVPDASLPLTDDPKGNRLIDIYDHYFQCLPADTPALRELAYRLRFQIYCVEHPLEDPRKNPGMQETDEHDDRAAHTLLIHRPTRMVAGAVRLIFPSQCDTAPDLPVRRICRHPWVKRDSLVLPFDRTAEISRFAIATAFRRPLLDQVPVVGDGNTGRGRRRRLIPHNSLGLMRSVVAMAAETGMTHVCALMEPVLLRLLGRLGIHFNNLGPLVNYHGLRKPCFSDLDSLLARTWLERREVWEVLTRDGQIWPLDEDIVDSLQSAAPNTH